MRSHLICRSALIAVGVLLVFPAGAGDAPGPLTRDLSGIADADALGGEAKGLDKAGIYCWWPGPRMRPGYFEILARARVRGNPGVLHFVVTNSHDEKQVTHAITRTQRGQVRDGAYTEVYCGAFYWDGSYPMRVSDWSSPGLLVDWVRLVPISASQVRDPLPDALKQYVAPRLRDTPGVDADLSEWAGVPVLALGPQHARSASYGGSADLSALCRFAWDATHLYFACEVTDNSAQFLQDTRRLSEMWKFDGIQMAFDAAHDARTPGYAVDDYEYGFAMTADGPRAYRWVAGNNLPLGDVPTIDVAVTRNEATRVTSYEVAIPFKELSPFGPERPHCGMTVAVNDCDSGESQRAWLEWTPGITGAKDPSAFGALTLSESPPSATGVTVQLIGDNDLSQRDSAQFALQVRSPTALGGCRVEWQILRQGADGEPVAMGALDTGFTEPFGSATIPLDVHALGQGRFELQARLMKDEMVALASARFFRFDITGLSDRLASITARTDAQLQRIERLRLIGRQAHYPRATLGAVGEFVRFVGDDLKAGKYERAESVMTELDALLGEASAEIDEVAVDPAADLSVPPLPAERITVRDGVFYSGDEPQLLFGYCGWWQLWTAVHRLAPHGLNHIQDSIIAPFALFPDAGETPDKPMMQGLDWAWERGDATHIPYSRMLACNQVPETFREKHPEATGGGWSGLCPLSPALRDFESRYLRTCAETAARHRSTAVHVLYGESQFRLSDHPLEVAALAEHLKRKYQTLDALNAAWGAGYRNWDEIGSAKQATSPVAWHNKGRFSQQLFTQWSAWLQQQVHEVDPAALCTGYPSLLSWDDSSDFSGGIDIEALCRVFNVNGFDTAALDYGGSRWAMSSITGFAMPHDMCRAFNPQNPNFDPELHLVNLSRPYPEQYVRAALIQGALHGMSAANLWVFQRTEGMDSMLTFQPRVMSSYLRTCLDLRRLVRPIIAFQKAPAQVAILYSMTSVAYEPQHLPQMRAAYEGTFFSDTKVGFVTERTVLEGALNSTRLLILPLATHLPEDVAQAISRWAAAGGELVLIGDCMAMDDADAPLKVKLPAEENVQRLQPTNAPEQLREALEPLIDRTVRRPTRCVDESGRPLNGVEMRTAEMEGDRLIYAINMNKGPVTLDLSPRPDARLIDLRTGKAIGLPARLGSLDVFIARVKR